MKTANNVNNQITIKTANRMRGEITKKIQETENLFRLEQILRFIDNINRAD